MRSIGWNIWKGFACFSSSARLGTLAFSQESTAIPQVTSAENQRGGRERTGVQLLNKQSTPTMRKHFRDNWAVGSCGSYRDHITGQTRSQAIFWPKPCQNQRWCSAAVTFDPSVSGCLRREFPCYTVIDKEVMIHTCRGSPGSSLCRAHTIKTESFLGLGLGLSPAQSFAAGLHVSL